MDTWTERFPQAYQEWVKAGGIENNFRKHALAIGLQKPTVADLDFLITEAQVDRKQIRDLMRPFLLLP